MLKEWNQNFYKHGMTLLLIWTMIHTYWEKICILWKFIGTIKGFNTLALSVYCILFIQDLFFLFQVSIAISNSSCSVSRSTVEIVDNCPENEVGMRQAAARKNCAAYASNCSEPEKLVYHCVINSSVNQTLEVCAYWRITLFGKIWYISPISAII